MPHNCSATPKGVLTIKNIGSDFTSSNVVPSGLGTLKWRRGSFLTTLEASHNTFSSYASAKAFKEVVAKVDYKIPRVSGTVLNTKYELGPKKYTVGATWDGRIRGKALQQKVTWSNKDKKVAGETTVTVASGQKANAVYNQARMISAKYTVVNNDFTYEPSYNFDKKAPAVSIAKKKGKDHFKVAYDLKSENASVEWAHKPFKVVVSSLVSSKPSVGKPTVAATFENVFEF